MADQPGNNGFNDRGNPIVTIIVVIVVAFAAVGLFMLLRESSSSPRAQGAPAEQAQPR